MKRFPTWGDAAHLVDVMDVRPTDDGFSFVTRGADRRPAAGRRGQPDARAGDRGRRPLHDGSPCRLGQHDLPAGGRRPRAAPVRVGGAQRRAAPSRALAVQVFQGDRLCAAGTLLLDVPSADVVRHAAERRAVPGPYECEPLRYGRDRSRHQGRRRRLHERARRCRSDRPMMDAWVRFRQVPADPPLHAGLLAQFTGHMSIAAALRPHAGVEPGPGAPHALHGDQRHRSVPPRRRPGGRVDALPPSVDLRRRRHDPRGEPGATTAAATWSPPSPWTPWCGPSPAGARAPWTRGPRCEPHDRPRTAECPAGRTLHVAHARDRGLHGALPAAGAGEQGRRTVDRQRARPAAAPTGTTTRPTPSPPATSPACRPSPTTMPRAMSTSPWDAVGCLVRGGRRDVRAPAQPVPPGGLPALAAPAAGRGGRHDAGRHGGHPGRLRDRPRAPPLRRPAPRPHGC